MLQFIRRCRSLHFLALVAMMTMTSSPLLAQTEPAATASATTEPAWTQLFGNAVRGDSAAQSELIRSYVLPAFVLLTAIVISYTIASAIGRYVGGMVSRKVDLTLGKFLTKAVRNALMLMVGFGVLMYFEIDITGLAAVLAAVGFAIGMALQGTLGNIASGIMLLAFRPFKVDDYIVIADTQGTVEEIDLFTTRLNTLDNRHVIVPNGQIFGSKLENYTRNRLRRVDVKVGASYGSDLKQTRAALQRAASIVKSSTEREPQIVLSGLGASSVDWEVRAWCPPQDYWAVRENIVEAVKNELDRANIGIPFPQMDIHVGGKLLAKAA